MTQRHEFDEAQLTAYALGETEGAEHAAIEAAVQNDPELAKQVAEIRELGAVLEQEFAARPAATLSDEQRAKIAAAASVEATRGRLFTMPNAMRAAAAALVVGGGVWWAFSVADDDTSTKRHVASDTREQAGYVGDHDVEAKPGDEFLAEHGVDRRGLGDDDMVTRVDPVTNGVTDGPTPTPTDSGTTSFGMQPEAVTVDPSTKPIPIGSGGLQPGTSGSPVDVPRANLGTTLYGALSPEQQVQLQGQVQQSISNLSVIQDQLGQNGAHVGFAQVTPNSGAQPTNQDALRLYYESLQVHKGGFFNSGTEADVRARHEYYFRKQLVDNYGVQLGNEAYAHFAENTFASVRDMPLSTFSTDVDTASYANLRRMLRAGQTPPPDAVRVEEMLNYFSYNYRAPEADEPFSIDVEIASCPWQPEHRLARIGLRGKDIELVEDQVRNLVFLIDVSGSMDSPDKLPLLKRGMKLLVENLESKDRVAIVTYAGKAACTLEPTPCNERTKILDAIDGLTPGGSTNGAGGIEMAYEFAKQNFDKEGVNRVILATDGDFNVGVSDDGPLTKLIEEKAKTGVFLSVLGFGTGNLKDSKMEALANNGNGNYAYIDSVREARKVLVRELGGTLVTIAKDVKIQIEFNPSKVASYRLIGYENRALAPQDFNDDKKDAGEIGAGHRVTALYQIVPVGVQIGAATIDPLKYQPKPELAPDPTPEATSNELMNVKLRYKEPDGIASKKIERGVIDDELGFDKASVDFRFAAAVAQFGMLLRRSQFAGTSSFESTRSMAADALGDDQWGYREEFLELVDLIVHQGKR